MMTLSGNYLTLEGGAPSLEDLAHGLAQMPRYAGQTVIRGWSVADHLVVCADIAEMFTGWPEDLQLHAILHDAHEAMTGDIPVPFKTPDMKRLQEELDARIYDRFSLPKPTAMQKNVVKVIDEEALLAEARVVAPAKTYERIIWERGHAANPVLVELVRDHLMTNDDSEKTFLCRAGRLLMAYQPCERVA